MHTRRTPVSVELPPHGVYVWETRHDHGFRMAPEHHRFAELFYVLDGTGTFVVHGTRHPCGPGDIVLVPPRAVHVIEDGAHPLTLSGIGVAAELLAHDPDVFTRIPPGRFPAAQPVSTQVRAGLRRLLFEQTQGKPCGRSLMVGLTLQLVTALARGLDNAPADKGRPAASPHLDAVRRFVADLTQRFYESAGIDRAAAEVGVSRRGFTRLFRLVTGCTYAKYLERVRIEYACQLLRETGRSVTTVAFECGYEDLSSFYRAFRRQTGEPPQRWRETVRSSESRS
jgi:AraC family L-rhamnose operon regulatory protein RhaS